MYELLELEYSERCLLSNDALSLMRANVLRNL